MQQGATASLTGAEVDFSSPLLSASPNPRIFF
jgi:hypothetical protein